MGRKMKIVKGKAKAVKKAVPTKRKRNDKSSVENTPYNGVATILPPKRKPTSGSFKKGNTLWQNSNSGRHLTYLTPQALLEGATKYFEWCDENPWVRTESAERITTDGELETATKEVPTQRPYTIEGFCIFSGASTHWWRGFRDGFINKLKKDNGDAEAGEFLRAINMVEDCIRNNKFEGAMVGAFNATLTSRDLGLKDQIDVTSKDKKITPPAFNVYNVGPELGKSEQEVEERENKS